MLSHLPKHSQGSRPVDAEHVQAAFDALLADEGDAD